MSGSRFVYVMYVRTTAEQLWQGLTDPAFTKRYWGETWQESAWEKGASWKMMIPDGRVGDSGEVLEIDRPHKLVLSWRNEFVPAMKAEGYSRMSYELEQQGDMVKLTLIHEMDAPDSKLIDAISTGWPELLCSLKSLLETGEPLIATTKWPEGH
jgi:uncharacterized protein YndB with AHSA1/START domain